MKIRNTTDQGHLTRENRLNIGRKGKMTIQSDAKTPSHAPNQLPS